MAHYGMGDNCTPVNLSNLINSKSEMEAWLPENPVVFSEERSDIYRIRTISGILTHYKSASAQKKGIYPPDDYLAYPGDQYVGIRIGLDHIISYGPDDPEPLIIEDEITIQISDDRDCCEIWGAMLSEDDLSPYLGSRLLEIYFTDTSLNTEYLQRISRYKFSGDYHNVQFINIRTDRGTFQFTVYNCHNGYYGHDVTVTSGGCMELYSGVI